jgi:hypothetical protein
MCDIYIMKLLTLVYVFCLFYVFIPGNLFKLPVKTSKMNHVLLHALLFSAVLSVSYPYVESIQLYEPMVTKENKDESEEEKKTPPVTATSSSTPPPPSM